MLRIPQSARSCASSSLLQLRLRLHPPMCAASTVGRRSVTRGRGVWRKGTPAAERFDNAVLRELPLDAEVGGRVRAVRGACFSRVAPTPLANPQLVIASPPALALAGIDVARSESDLLTPTAPGDVVSVDELVPFLAGNELFPGSETAAQCYCGHQFGYFSGQLGDGAAIYLGEVVNDARERWEVQLKGAGLTPFSRTADGRKVLRSTMREFLASEHMHALGVPTTRAGSVVVSRDTTVIRDMFYDGNPKKEPTAVVMRIAQSFLRFGSFEIFKDTDARSARRGPSAGLENKSEMMRQMLDFAIKQYFPAIHEKDEQESKAAVEESETTTTATSERKYVLLFEEVVQRTARLVAKWQSIGFCHGVLNTDNMSLVGDTLDYGPFGFMEHFNPEHICNTSDDGGRYRYEAQPEICKWNLSVLADQLALVVDRLELEPALDAYNSVFAEELSRLMRAKLGLVHQSFPSEDRALVDSLFDVFTATGADFTCVFRALAGVKPFDEESQLAVVNQLAGFSETLAQVKRRFSSFTDAQYEMVKMLMKENPVQARMYGIDDEAFAKMTAEREQLQKLNATTDAERLETVRAAWAKWIELYVERLKEESNFVVDEEKDVQRHALMQSTNPKFVLRNHVAQKAIDYATEGDSFEVENIFKLLTHPFDEGSADDLVYALPEDPSTPPLCVSCSS